MSLPRLSSCLIACLLTMPTVVTAHDNDKREDEPQYRVREIPPPDDSRCVAGYARVTAARKVNDRGEVVGQDGCYHETGDLNFPRLSNLRAFHWSRVSGTVQLPVLSDAATDTYARDLNNTGTIVGWQIEYGGFRAPVWPVTGGVMEVFTPGFCSSSTLPLARAESINESGAVAGSNGLVGPEGTCRTRWVLKMPWGEEHATPVLGGSVRTLNNNSVLAGTSANNAVKWSMTGGTVILSQGSFTPPISQVQVWGLNDQDVAVGVTEHYNDDFSCLTTSEAKLWDADGTEHVLPSLHNALRTVAFAINGRGQSVGYSESNAGCNNFDPAGWRAVTWNKHRVRDLNKLIPAHDRREIQLTGAYAINDRGQILVRGIRPGEALLPCPQVNIRLDTGEEFYDTSFMCHSEYAFLLTPKDD